jgi:putative endonuclease
MKYFLYILKSLIDEKLYIGVTSNLEKRLEYHNTGRVKSTKSRKPFVLVYSENCKTLSEARKREWFLKNTPQGGKLKKKLVLGTWSLQSKRTDGIPA